MLLSSTMYADYSQCLKRGSYRWVDKLVKRPQNVSVPLRRGIWLHRCLEDYHGGRDYLGSIHEMQAWGADHGVDPEKLQEIADECDRIMRGYIDFWPANSWQTLGSEIPIVLDTGDGNGIRATIDVAVKWRGEHWLVEHKSTGEIPPASWRSVDPQTALQYWLCHTVKPVIGGEVFLPVGIIFNYLLTEKPSIPRWKKDGTLYANCKPTTRAAFDQGWAAAPVTPVDAKADYAKLVNDDLFYRRFPVQRPEGNVQESMRDIIATLRDIRTAEQYGHYRRSFHVLTCRRFCPYADICIHEYILGQKSEVMRNELYMLDDGTRGEGR